MENNYEIHFAPLQGYTDLIYRNAFDAYFGNVDAYYTPFIRVEKDGRFRNKDVRELDRQDNKVLNLIPQILPGSSEEFRILMELAGEKGYRRVDINLGCPFPMIAGKKKGAGMLPYPELVKDVLAPVSEYPDFDFSLKMRLGWENSDECLFLADIINGLRFSHVTVHARIGKQQYKGNTDPRAFERFQEVCSHPLFYNGDITTVEQIHDILSSFPRLRGVMIGRGLLSSPFLAAEFKKNELCPEKSRQERLKSFHEALFSAYSGHLQGDSQLLTKMKSLWDYFLPDADRKALKKIKKSGKITDYTSAVGQILK